MAPVPLKYALGVRVSVRVTSASAFYTFDIQSTHPHYTHGCVFVFSVRSIRLDVRKHSFCNSQQSAIKDEIFECSFAISDVRHLAIYVCVHSLCRLLCTRIRSVSASDQRLCNHVNIKVCNTQR